MSIIIIANYYNYYCDYCYPKTVHTHTPFGSLSVDSDSFNFLGPCR